MIDWLKENKRFIKIRAIEQELKMPDSTLIKAVNDVQKLPKKWIEPIDKFLNNLKNCKSGGVKLKYKIMSAKELNIETDLTQTLGVREMHDLMEINIRTNKKFECVFIDKAQAQQIIEKLQLWVGKKDISETTKALPLHHIMPSSLDEPQQWFMDKYCVTPSRMQVIEHKGNDVVRFIHEYLMTYLSIRHNVGVSQVRQ